MRGMTILLLGLVAISAVYGNHFAVRNATTNKNCLILEANITGTVQYVNTNNATVSLPFSVPEDKSALVNEGSACRVDTDKLVIEFVPAILPPVPEYESNYKWQISFEFNKNVSTVAEQRYQLAKYALTVYFYSNLNHSGESNYTIPYVYAKPDGFQPEWAAALKSAQKETPNGFVCSQNQLPLNVTDSTLAFKNLKLVAFAEQDSPDFKSQVFEQCVYDVRTSDLVPIIVGACLAGLVIVVLIAYLIGRARAKRQGYASV